MFVFTDGLSSTDLFINSFQLLTGVVTMEISLIIEFDTIQHNSLVNANKNTTFFFLAEISVYIAFGSRNGSDTDCQG